MLRACRISVSPHCGCLSADPVCPPQRSAKGPPPDPRWADSYGREDWYGRRGGGKEKGGGWYDPKGEWSSRPSGRSWDDEWAPEWEWDASSSKAPAKPSTRDRGKEKGRDRPQAPPCPPSRPGVE